MHIIPESRAMTKLFARPVILAATVGLLIILGYLLLSSLRDGKRAQVEAGLERNRGDAAVQSGRDAVNAVGGQAAAEGAVDAITKENERAIREAKGADVDVGDPVRAAALRSLCQRSANKNKPECIAHLTR